MGSPGSDNSDSDGDEYEAYSHVPGGQPNGPDGATGARVGDDQAGGPAEMLARKRKIQRACDVCRRRKQRCNGFEMPDHRCSSCISSELPCTYVEGSKKRAAPKGYVESLESRLAKTEAMLTQLRPGVDLAAELGDPLDKSQFAARRRASKAKERELQLQQEEMQQHMAGPSSYGRPQPPGPGGSMAPPYLPNGPPGWNVQPPYPPGRQPSADMQYYRPGAVAHQSPPYYPDDRNPSSSRALFPPSAHQPPAGPSYLGPHASNRPAPSNGSDYRSSHLSSSLPLPLQRPNPNNGIHPLHRSASSSVSPYAEANGSRLAGPSAVQRVASDSSSTSPSSYPPPPPPILVRASPAASDASTPARVKAENGDGEKPAESHAGPAGGKTPVTHHDDEADLKSFVQLNHRDEQLFKRFMGKSSGLPLLFSALGFKYGNQPNRYGQEIKLHRTTSRAAFWRIPRWESTPQNSAPSPENGGPPQSPALAAMLSSNPFASWPDPNLAMRLIEAYFDRVNVLLPLLHKPTFYKQYSEQLYNADPGFARICLLVFAVGSTYVDDPRVRFPRDDGGTHGIDSSGWIFFHAFGRMVRHRLAPTELCDLQVSVLLVQFLRFSSQPGACWLLVGEGLRYAQDVGVHRSGVQRSSDPQENELFKRGFWCLYTLDREFSAFMGRPLTLQDDDFDVGLPAECDDEYWDAGADGRKAFEQPAGKPSKLAAFTHQIRLSRILSKALLQLYTILPPHLRRTDPAEVIRDTLAAELASWLEAVPEHLKWDPAQADGIFFRQSCHLFLDKYLVETYVHRPFLPSPQNPVPSSSESYVDCVNAANLAAHVMDTYYQKTNEVQPFVFHSAYTAAMILLISVWGGKSTGVESDPAVSMQGVERCVHALAEAERRHFGIGRARDAISVLSAPRVDYLAESLARRKVRVEKEATQELFRVPKVPNEGSFQVAARPADPPRFPPDPSLSNPPTPRSISNGSGHVSLPPHMQSPSQALQQYPPGAGSYGSPQGSAPSPYQNPFSPGGHLHDGPTPPDFGSFLGVFPDFYNAGGNDPSMTLFPNNGDYFVEGDFFGTQQTGSVGLGGANGSGVHPLELVESQTGDWGVPLDPQ